MTQLSKHYTLEDCQHSDTAIRLKIPNIMNTAQIANAKKLLVDIAEPICEHYGIRITFSCLFRCFRLNSNPKIGGSSTSEHLNANAFDGEKFGAIPFRQVFNDIVDGKIKDSKGMPIKNHIDQMIFETRTKVVKGKTVYTYWIHIGRRDVPRHQFETGVNGAYKVVNRI